MKKYIVDLSRKVYKELIECKDCKYYRDQYCQWDVCSYFDKPMLETDYCSKAERKEKLNEFSNINI